MQSETNTIQTALVFQKIVALYSLEEYVTKYKDINGVIPSQHEIELFMHVKQASVELLHTV